MSQVITISFKDSLPSGYKEINCTSRGFDKFKMLSPFINRNVSCYGDLVSKNMENAWQFSKVYPQHNLSGVPTQEWYEWRNRGFEDGFAHRYPMGKGSIPLYSFWDNKKLGYIEARRQIYFPLYENSVKNTDIFAELQTEYNKGTLLAIRDFDVYRIDISKISLKDVVDNPMKKAGHGFVLYKMLTGEKI